MLSVLKLNKRIIVYAALGVLLLAINSITTAKNTRVIDESGSMAPEQQSFVARYHEVLLRDFDIDYRVLVTPTIQKGMDKANINLHAVRQFKALNVGAYSRTGRGLLLLIDTQNNIVRLEIGGALEGIYTDAFVAYVQQRQMVHFFRTGRIADGILATTELIYERARKAAARQEFDPREAASFSAGGGASTHAQIGAGKQNQIAAVRQNFNGNTPKEVVMDYMKAMQQRNNNPELSIYSAATKVMLKGWTVTPAQMDNVVSTFRSCHIEKVVIDQTNQYAVVRYSVKQRTCSPYFLIREQGAWKLDLTMMQKAIRFNHRNQWRFVKEINHPYRYAFTDWRLDRHGFPHRPKQRKQ